MASDFKISDISAAFELMSSVRPPSNTMEKEMRNFLAYRGISLDGPKIAIISSTEKKLYCLPDLCAYKDIPETFESFIPSGESDPRPKSIIIINSIKTPKNNGIYMVNITGELIRRYLLPGIDTSFPVFHLGRNAYLLSSGIVDKDPVIFKIEKLTFEDLLRIELPLDGFEHPPRIMIDNSETREGIKKFSETMAKYLPSIETLTEKEMRAACATLVDIGNMDYTALCKHYSVNHKIKAVGMNYSYLLEPPFLGDRIEYCNPRQFIDPALNSGKYVFKIALRKTFDWIHFNSIHTIPPAENISILVNGNEVGWDELPIYPEFVNLGKNLILKFVFSPSDFDYQKYFRIFINATGYWFYTWELDPTVRVCARSFKSMDM